jgi:hypothetical protein
MALISPKIKLQGDSNDIEIVSTSASYCKQQFDHNALITMSRTSVFLIIVTVELMLNPNFQSMKNPHKTLSLLEGADKHSLFIYFE